MYVSPNDINLTYLQMYYFLATKALGKQSLFSHLFLSLHFLATISGHSDTRKGGYD